MFSKAKDKNSQDSKANASPTEASFTQAGAASASATQSNSKRPVANSRAGGGVPSIISSDVVMHGNLNAGGEVQFDGALEGDIKAVTLIVGEKATVKGEIICDRVTVRGRVEGGIRAKQVSLAATAHILGDIIHSSLSVENGAHFEGACRHSDDPLSEAASKDFRKHRPATPATSPAKKTATTASESEAPAEPAVDAPKKNGSTTPSFLSTNRSPLR